MKKDRRYLIQVWGDVFPILHGPYKTDGARFKQAKQLHEEDEGTLIRLDIDDRGVPDVSPFSEEELPSQSSQ